eukprot:SAG31_NODE_3754_length_3920_cov_2.925936_3_plen_588_part_00
MDLVRQEIDYGLVVTGNFESQRMWLVCVYHLRRTINFASLILSGGIMVVQWGSLVRDYSTQLLPIVESTSARIPMLTAVPRFLTFSFTSPSLSVPYTILLLVVVVFLITTAAGKYAAEQSSVTTAKIVADADSYKMAKLALAGWDFSLMDPVSVEEAKLAKSQQLLAAVKEEEIKKAIADRTESERRKLVLRRVSGLALNILLILGCWFLIIYATIVLVPDYGLVEGTFLNTVHRLMPLTNICLSLANGILPAATSLLVKFERHDDAAYAFKMETFRLYTGKILNVLVLMYTGANSFIGGQRFGLPGLKTIWVSEFCRDAHYPDEWPCPEDELGWLLFKSCLLDFFTSKISVILFGEFARFKARRKSDMSSARSDFNTPPYVIQLLYTQCLAWLATPYLPMVALWQPLALYATFKFDGWVLRRYKRKPTSMNAVDSQSIRTFAIFFYMLSLGIAMANYYTFMFSETCPIGNTEAIRHSGVNCNTTTSAFSGAFSYYDSPFSAILPTDETSAFFSVLNIVVSPAFAYLVAAVWMMKAFLEGKHRAVIEKKSAQQVAEMSEQVQILSDTVKKRDTRIEYLEKARKRTND